jgi:hypothetical protein
MLDALARLALALLIVDEAHCVSTWVHHFCRAYFAFSCLKERFLDVAIGAFTATADRATRPRSRACCCVPITSHSLPGSTAPTSRWPQHRAVGHPQTQGRGE